MSFRGLVNNTAHLVEHFALLSLWVERPHCMQMQERALVMHSNLRKSRVSGLIRYAWLG